MISINYESQRLTYFTQEKERYERKLKELDAYKTKQDYAEKRIDELRMYYTTKLRFYTDAVKAFS